MDSRHTELLLPSGTEHTLPGAVTAVAWAADCTDAGNTADSTERWKITKAVE